MSLLDDAMTTCVMQDKKTISDGYGGYNTAWTDGAEFQAAIVLDSSNEGLIAQAMTVKGLYIVTTRKNCVLHYHDVFKRSSDEKIFRVTTDGEDKNTPDSATLNMRQVRAEEWELV